ncbi:MAG: hypothetical protein LC792_18245 [Actinobacteria bacterium]|nr:hypothetical protein [Actinomycetota bacterium]
MADSTVYRYACCGMGWLPAETATLSDLRAVVRQHRDQAHGGSAGPSEGLYTAPASDPNETTPMGRAERLRARL